MNDNQKEEHSEFVLKPGNKRLKRKLSDTISYDDLVEGWTQCCFLLKNKGRLCNVGRVPNSLYCGNHITQEKDKEDTRIPCPLDPTHTVYAPKLESHLKICNAEKKKQFFESQPFYKLNCNKGTGGITKNQDITISSGSPELFVQELFEKINRMFEKVQLFPFPEQTDREITKNEEDLNDPIGNPIREILGKKQTSFKHWKHIEQDICIVKRLISNSLLSLTASSSAERMISSPIEHVYVEYGAGKGLLGQSINIIDPNSALLFIERSGNRKKVDKFLNERKCHFQRFKLDIKDCFLPQLPFIHDFTLENQSKEDGKKSEEVTIVAKHLCGVATDLAIRSLSHFSSPSSSSSPSLSHLSRSLAIATCCHHACIYEDYVGHEVFFKDFCVTKEEFNTLKSWSGWATLDVDTLRRRKTENQFSIEKTDNEGKTQLKNDSAREDDEEEEGEQEQEEEAVEHNAPPEDTKYRHVIEKLLSYEEMVSYGRKIKRIIDYGRLLYLEKNLNLSSKLEQYCEESFSPECFLLMAVEKRN